MKPIKSGLGFIVDKNWNPIMAKSREEALKIGARYQSKESRRLGFKPALWEGEDYYRVSYGRKC